MEGAAQQPPHRRHSGSQSHPCFQVGQPGQSGEDFPSQGDNLHHQHRQLSQHRADGRSGRPHLGNEQGVDHHIHHSPHDLGEQHLFLPSGGHQNLNAHDVSQADEHQSGHDQLHGQNGGLKGLARQQVDGGPGKEDEVEAQGHGQQEDKPQGLLSGLGKSLLLPPLHVVGHPGQQHRAQRGHHADQDVLDLHRGIIVAVLGGATEEAQHHVVHVGVHRGGDGHSEEHEDGPQVAAEVVVPHGAHVHQPFEVDKI